MIIKTVYMKKRFLIDPALMVFAFLLSIAGHSQELFTNYLAKEKYSARIEELRKEFGANKKMPKEIELECLTALSYYPQLKNTHIQFRFGNISATMISQPKLNSIFKTNGSREYQVIITKPGPTRKGLQWTELSFNALVGWIGHELGHIMHYDHMAFTGILLIGIKYALPQFRRKLERFTDQVAIKHDLGYALYEGTDYTVNRSKASAGYKKRLLKFYLSPAEIKKYISLKNAYKVNYHKLRIFENI